MGDGPSLGWDQTQQQLTPTQVSWPSRNMDVNWRRVVGDLYSPYGGPEGSGLPTQLYAQTSSSRKRSSSLVRKLEELHCLQFLCPGTFSSSGCFILPPGPLVNTGICKGETPAQSHPTAKQKAMCLLLLLARESENNNKKIFCSFVKRKVTYPRRGLDEAMQDSLTQQQLMRTEHSDTCL